MREHDTGEHNIASSVSNRGDVAGTAFTPEGSPHAFLWTRESGKMQDLGTVPGFVAFVNPCCNTINNRREIVGWMLDDAFNSRAFYYAGANMVDLNNLLSKHVGREWVLQAAQSINESGQIAGFGLHYGQVRAFLATPSCDRDGNRGCDEDHDDR
jgi:probable HAF family extracellular repeat protein